ncbi:MAG: type II toxin-antitoxin system PemK/MazF family toxin [Candidatus Eremiobacteraeota bacterium]|nr:type II toxin-antitoxin system PemK/MazF family toxin [Candidatus Eremiobacteraeota bacterium]
MNRGEIFFFDLEPTVGSETRKIRPCIVVHRDVREDRSPTTIVCPISDARDRPGDVLNPFIPAGIAGLGKNSRVICNQVRALDKMRVTSEALGRVPSAIMAEIERGLRAILDL